MRKALYILAAIVIFCAWGFVVIQITAPEKLLPVRGVISGLFQEEDTMRSIEDEYVPLAGPVVENAIERNGRLRVQDGGLVNEHGAPVQLRGMSSHGIAWYPQYSSRAAIETTQYYGANLYRVAMYVDDDPGNYTTDEKDQQKNKNDMFDALDNAIGLGMYAIADWHILKENNPLNRLDCAMAFFDELSQRYADEPGIIYEICNEPNGDTTWDDICAYADRVIPIIRKNAPDAVIIVGTPDFCTDLQPAMDNPLPYDNVLYAYHYYSGKQKAEYQEALDAALAANLPVFVSEWGFGSDEEPNILAEDYGKAFLAYMQTHGISWANWSLCNKEEAFSAILPHVDKPSGWTRDELTVGGRIVFDAF